MKRPLSLPLTVRQISVSIGSPWIVSPASWLRSSAEIADQPSPEDDPSSLDAGYFLAPCACRRGVYRVDIVPFPIADMPMVQNAGRRNRTHWSVDVLVVDLISM